MEDWALIRRLAAEGVPKARIAARLGISRTTVVKAVQSDSPPRYQRKPASSSFSPVEARVRQLLEDNPELPAVVLAERVEWTGSMSWFRQNVMNPPGVFGDSIPWKDQSHGTTQQVSARAS